LVDAKLLDQLRRGAYLINPARGGLVDDDAVLAALDSGQLSGAALDVFNEEPLPPDHPYWAHPKVAVTPHMASRTHAGSALPQLAENVRRARAGQPLINRVDRKAGY
jgi:glyoxylate/hydroxypyruvate reductase A